MKSTNGWASFKLKWNDSTYFYTGNGNNFSGFSVLPGGLRFDGTFNNIGKNSVWWSFYVAYSDNYNWNAYCLILSYDDYDINSTNFYKIHGLSVRCLKD